MSKSKTPLLSLEAHGTIGDAITYQTSGGLKIARKKPHLPYFLTLPVQYQRWLYQDYAYLWTQQSLATRQSYQSLGSRHHLTGFQYWMKYQLTNLPDIVGMWHLDHLSNGTALDYSRNGNHGVVIGCFPTTAVIDDGFYFDGINDEVRIPNHPTLDLISAGSVEAFFYIEKLLAHQGIVTKGAFAWDAKNNYSLRVDNSDHVYFSIGNIGDLTMNEVEALFAPFTPYHAVGTWDGAFVRMFLNGYQTDSMIQTITPAISTSDLYFGRWSGAYRLEGWIDHVIIYDRALDPTEILRHSERRWPL